MFLNYKKSSFGRVRDFQIVKSWVRRLALLFRSPLVWCETHIFQKYQSLLDTIDQSERNEILLPRLDLDVYYYHCSLWCLAADIFLFYTYCTSLFFF